MVRHGFNPPIVMVNVGVGDQVRTVAGTGGGQLKPGAATFCEYVFGQDRTFIIPDATQDERFKWDASVADAPGIRFYAGTPLRLTSGQTFGALCVMDTQVRSFSEADQQQLERYAALAAEELEEHGALLEREGVLGSIADAFFALDRAERFVYLNEQAERLLACTRAEARGQQVWSLLPESTQGAFNTEYHRAVATQTPRTFDVYHAADERWYGVTIYPYSEGVSVCLSDVTEAKRADVRRTSHMRMLEMIAEGAPFDQTIQGVAEALERQSRNGWALVLITDPADAQLTHSTDPSLPAAFWKALRSAFSNSDETPYGTALSEHRPVHVHDVTNELRWPHFRSICLQHGMRGGWIAPVLSEGKAVGVLALHTQQPHAPSKEQQQFIKTSADLVGIAFERHRHLKQLHETHEEFRLLAEHAADVLTRHALDTTYEYVSPSIYALTGYRQEDLIGKRALDFIHPDEVEQVVTAHRMAQRQEPVQTTYRLLHKDGHYVWVESTSRIAGDKGTGRPTEIFSITRDISDRIRTEEAMRRSARRLEILNSVGRTILNTSSMQTVGRAVVERMRDVIAYDYACVLEYDERNQKATVLASDAAAELEYEPGAQFDYERAEHERQWPKQETQYILDLQNSHLPSALHRELAGLGMRSCLVVPAIVEGEAVGALNFGSYEPSSYTAMDLAVAREVASMLAVAIRQEHYRQHLVAAKEKAEEVSRLKSSFLANMSHEIRTPLTSIIGFADVLGDEVEGEARQVAKVIHRSGQRLKETIASVLELARLESESANMCRERVRINDEVIEATEFMQPQAAERGIELVADCPDDAVVAMLDRAALYRVLTNLISNAIKFTEQGRVLVRLVSEGQEVAIEVADTGVGMSEQFLPQIFGEFTQETDTKRSRGEGSGLGLTITQRLVELMRGRIDVTSTKGEGTTFRVYFPAVS